MVNRIENDTITLSKFLIGLNTHVDASQQDDGDDEAVEPGMFGYPFAGFYHLNKIPVPIDQVEERSNIVLWS